MPQQGYVHAVKSFVSFAPFTFNGLLERYLTKMCDQVVALLSPDYSASIVWNDEDGKSDTNSEDIDAGDSERLFTFEVAKTKEQEESAVSRPGFQVRLILCLFLA